MQAASCNMLVVPNTLPVFQAAMSGAYRVGATFFPVGEKSASFRTTITGT